MSRNTDITTPPSIVHIVDDDAAVRDSLKWLVEAADHRVQTHASAEAFLEEYDPAIPGCVVLDLRMPGMSGQSLLEVLIERGIELPVIMISAHGDVQAAVQAMKAGAIDFLEKPFRESDLLEKIEIALARDRAARQEQEKLDVIHERIDRLTPRETEVMGLVVQGYLNKQIARELGISEKTVEVHRANVMRKMEADSVAELVRMAVASGDGQSQASESDEEPGGQA